MTTYRVPVDKVATNYCYAYIEVEADDPEAAKEAALAKVETEDGVDWLCDVVISASYDVGEPYLHNDQNQLELFVE